MATMRDGHEELSTQEARQGAETGTVRWVLHISLGLAVVGHLQKPFLLAELKSVLESAAVVETPEAAKDIPAIAVSDEQIRVAVKKAGRKIERLPMRLVEVVGDPAAAQVRCIVMDAQTVELRIVERMFAGEDFLEEAIRPVSIV